MVKIVSLYTGSSHPKIDTPFKARSIAATIEMARYAGLNADIVQYGGGLYGHLLDVMEEVGRVGGKMRALISPAYYDPNEIYPDHVEVVQVKDDVERAQKFLKAEAHIVTPGGDGTICESLLSHNDNLARLFSDRALRPVTLLNLDGYYDDHRALFKKAADYGYSSAERQKELKYFDTPKAVASYLWTKPKFS